MLQMCSGIYLVFAVMTILLFRVTLLEAPWYKTKKKEYDS
jgi:hypothetical protein